MDNILSSIKTMLNVEQSITAFDSELLMFINSAISELVQAGVGPQDGLDVNSDTNWSDFSDNVNVVAYSTQYVWCKVRLLWDPPSNSFITSSFEKQAEQSYWRAYIESDEIRRKEGQDGDS